MSVPPAVGNPSVGVGLALPSFGLRRARKGTASRTPTFDIPVMAAPRGATFFERSLRKSVDHVSRQGGTGGRINLAATLKEASHREGFSGDSPGDDSKRERAIQAMEKTLEKGGLPKIDSIEELATFWDTHDLTDFEGDLEEVDQPVFVRVKGTVLTVSLRAGEAQRLRRIASSKGVKDAALIRRWIVERLHGVSELDQPPDRAMQRSAARPGRVPSARK